MRGLISVRPGRRFYQAAVGVSAWRADNGEGRLEVVIFNRRAADGRRDDAIRDFVERIEPHREAP